MTPELLQLIASAVSLNDSSIISQEQLLGATDLPVLVPPHPEKNESGLWGQLHSLEISIELKAGLLLIHDFLEESHQLSQSIEGKVNGDYWHAIMHRREPDYSNSKYWFRRVGDHPIFPQLYDHASVIVESDMSHQLLASGKWSPFDFVDFCESCAYDPDSKEAVIARRIQWVEMILLMQYCYQEATR